MVGLVQQCTIVLWSIVLCIVLGSPAKAADVEAGKKLYQERCSPCHGPDGKADTPTAKALNPKPRDHSDGNYMNALSDEHLFKVIKEGGAPVGKSPIMPPQVDLQESQIQDIIAFVRLLAVPPYSDKK